MPPVAKKISAPCDPNKGKNIVPARATIANIALGEISITGRERAGANWGMCTGLYPWFRKVHQDLWKVINLPSQNRPDKRNEIPPLNYTKC